MIEKEDAKKVLQALTSDLVNVANNPKNFEKLPDSFWGYFARGHDSKGAFGIILTYSEKHQDVDNLIQMYEKWVKEQSTLKR